jgi:hypothetical protein
MCTGKGQSAIEYLMTYGWMLLVVALIGGAVFSLVQGQAIESVSGFTGTEVSINDFGMNSDDELMLSIRNTAADRVKVKAVELEDPETGATTRVLSEKQIEVGDRKTVKVNGFETTSSSNKQNLKIIYGSGGIDDQVVEGTITGKLKAKNHVYLQNAVFNRSTNTLNITARNTGNTEAEIDYTVNSDSNSFAGGVGAPSSGETQAFTVNTDETFLLQNVSLDVEGQYFSNSQKKLKCTPTKGLVGYWPFNNEQTQNGWAIDLSGQQNNGSLENGVEAGADGRVGEAYDYSGNSDAVTIADDYYGIGGNNPRSTSFWFKSKDNSAKQHSWVKWGSDNTGEKYFIRAHTDSGNCYARVENAGGNHFGLDTDVCDNEWHHIAVVLPSGDSNVRDHKIYVDGVEEPSYGGSSQTLNTDTSTNKVHVGNKIDGIGQHAPADGKIDEVRIYNRSLSQEQIQRLYNVRSEDWAVSGCKITN